MLKKSLFYTYFIQIYSALINVLLVPFYLNLLGIEQFGLIGFFTLLQNIMMILDGGISRSISRQTAITKHNSFLFNDFLFIFRKIIISFSFIAIFIFIFTYVMNDYIINTWIKSNINKDVLAISTISMFLVVALKYISGPFSGILIGLEEHTLLSKLNFLFITLKFPMGLVVLYIFGSSVSNYFIYQIFVSIFELSTLFIVAKYKSHIIINKKSIKKEENKSSFKSLLIFSGQLSLLSITWIIVTQIDKLILSTTLHLKEYSYYTIAVTMSGVILVFSTPLSQVMLGRLSVLFRENNFKEYVELYTKAFSIIIIIMTSLSSSIFIFSKPIIYMWTNNIEIVNNSFQYVRWLTLGNTISILMTFTYLLQYSMGNLKKHLIVYLSYSLLLIPTSIYIATVYQGYGSALFYFIHNLILFLSWGLIVNYKNIQNINSFLIIYIFLPSFTISVIIFNIFNSNIDLLSMNRILILSYIIFIGIINIMFIGLFYILFKKKISAKFRNIEFIKIRNDL